MGVCARIKMEGAPSQAVAYKPASAFVASFSSYLLDVVHLPDHSKVATADSDRTIKLFDATTSQLDREIRAHTDTITQLHYSSAHPHVFFSSSADKSVRAWDTRSGDSAFTLSQRGQCQSVGIGVDGTALVAGSESDLMIWDLRKPTQAKMCFEDCHDQEIARSPSHREVNAKVRASNENVIPPTEEGDDESMVDDLSDHNVRRALRNRYRYVLNPYYLRKNQRRDSSH